MIIEIRIELEALSMRKYGTTKEETGKEYSHFVHWFGYSKVK